jgi:hypothetical protein
MLHNKTKHSFLKEGWADLYFFLLVAKHMYNSINVKAASSYGTKYKTRGEKNHAYHVENRWRRNEVINAEYDNIIKSLMQSEYKII